MGATPQNLLDEINELKRRLRVLETAGRLGASSTDGTIAVRNDAGEMVASFGQDPSNTATHGIHAHDATTGETVAKLGEVQLTNIAPAGTEVDQGLLVQGATGGDIVLATRTRGLIVPSLQFGWQAPNTFTAITAASFTTVWQCILSSLPSTAIRVQGTIGCDAGTTGEVRLNIGGTILSSAVTLPAATFTNYDFKLDMVGNGAPLGSGPHTINLQVRRTAGTGNVNVYVPSPARAWDTKSLGADTDGIYP